MTNAIKSPAIKPAEAVGVVIDLGFCFKPRREPVIAWFADRMIEACMKKYFLIVRGERLFRELSKEHQQDLEENCSFDHTPREAAIIIAQIVLPHLTADELLDVLTQGDLPGGSKRVKELIELCYPQMEIRIPVIDVFQETLKSFDKQCDAEALEAAKTLKREEKQMLANMRKLGWDVNVKNRTATKKVGAKSKAL